MNKGGVMTYSIRMISKQNEKVIGNFISHNECKKHLIDSGFYESSGVWKHIDGRTAGISSDLKSFKNCLKQVNNTSSMWNSILRK